MFNPGDKIRCKLGFQNKEWLKATEVKGLPVNIVVTVESVRYDNVKLHEDIGNRGAVWNPNRFERVVPTKSLEEWL